MTDDERPSKDEIAALRAQLVSALDLDGPQHARHNLDGATVDIETYHGHADAVCLRTLRRVRDQLGKVERLIRPPALSETDA